MDKVNALEWYSNVSEGKTSLGLSSKVKKTYSEKPSDSLLNMFEYVVDKETFMAVLNYHGISCIEDDTGVVYATTNLSVRREAYKVKIVFKKEGYMIVSDSPFDRYIVEKARADEEFGKFCIQLNNLLEYVKFKVSKEHPLPNIVIDTIISGIKDYKSIYENYIQRIW
jgi:hypothetical protein